MYTNTKLKAWTLITHFFIVIGAGHGIACLGVIELAGLFNFAEAEFTLSFLTPFKNSWHAVAISSLLGQIALILSIVLNSKKIKIILHIAGLLLLWMSIYYFTHNTEYTSSTYLGFLFCIPFLICTILPLLPFIIAPVKRLYNWIQS